MADERRPDNHLAVIRTQLARLVALLERAHDDRTSGNTGADAEEALLLGRDLLREVAIAEELIANHAESAEALRRIDERYLDGMRRVDEIQERLDRGELPRRPDPSQHAKGTGSTIGDSVRDSFLNMGP